jgi:hypothetical protein
LTFLDFTSQPAFILFSTCETPSNTDVYALSPYKQLSECIKQVEQIEAKVEGLLEKKEEPTTRLDSYFIKNNKIAES